MTVRFGPDRTPLSPVPPKRWFLLIRAQEREFLGFVVVLGGGAPKQYRRVSLFKRRAGVRRSSLIPVPMVAGNPNGGTWGAWTMLTC